jgi:hypothetical protein
MPREDALCLVAPSVRLSVRAIFAAGVLWRARLFKMRTSSLVHPRRFDFLAMRLSTFTLFLTCRLSIGQDNTPPFPLEHHQNNGKVGFCTMPLQIKLKLVDFGLEWIPKVHSRKTNV